MQSRRPYVNVLQGERETNQSQIWIIWITFFIYIWYFYIKNPTLFEW